jgi:hypothetical protein
LGLTKAIQNRVQNKVHEAKEKVNPMSTTNKNARVEHKRQQIEERQVERESYQKERAHQIAERGKHKAQQEYGTYKSGGSHKGKSVKGYASYAGSVPMFKAVDPMSALIGTSKKPKPKTPSRTTTVTTGNKTIRITEKLSEEEQQQQKKKKSPSLFNFDVDDPLSF